MVHGDRLDPGLDHSFRLGINAAPDGPNRFAVLCDAVLFNDDNSNHPLVINQHGRGPADSATQVFQSGFSGRVEMGWAGENDFSFKVGLDGVT